MHTTPSGNLGTGWRCCGLTVLFQGHVSSDSPASHCEPETKALNIEKIVAHPRRYPGQQSTEAAPGIRNRPFDLLIVILRMDVFGWKCHEHTVVCQFQQARPQEIRPDAKKTIAHGFPVKTLHRFIYRGSSVSCESQTISASAPHLETAFEQVTILQAIRHIAKNNIG